MADVDCLIIGGGPAGLAAATEGVRAGLSVTVVDEQAAPGGQIWRGVEGAPEARASVLGADTMRGAEAIRAFRQCGAELVSGAVVWNVDRDGTVTLSRDGASREMAAKHIIIATGALERPVPVPGWTLPGVMTAGGLQILLKTAGVVPEGPVVVAGAGPLLWLVASQMVRAGHPPAALVETVAKGRALRLWRDLARALPGAGTLAKGAGMIRTVLGAGVPVWRGARDLRVEGQDAAERLVFTAGGKTRSLSARIVALHQGVIPNQQITRSIGAAHHWIEDQASFAPSRNDWMELDIPGFSVAGDGGGIDGADAAALEGRLAALGAACRLGRIGVDRRDQAARPIRRGLRVARAPRAFLDRLYAPPRETMTPDDPSSSAAARR